MKYAFSRLLFRCKRIRRRMRWQPIKCVCTDPSLGSQALPMPIVPQICSFIASAMSLRSPNKVEHIGGSCMSGWKHVRQAKGILPVVSLRVFCNGQIGEVQKKVESKYCRLEKVRAGCLQQNGKLEILLPIHRGNKFQLWQIRLLKIAVLAYHFFLRNTFHPLGVDRPSRPLTSWWFHKSFLY